jgi:hypothetical protein
VEPDVRGWTAERGEPALIAGWSTTSRSIAGLPRVKRGFKALPDELRDALHAHAVGVRPDSKGDHAAHRGPAGSART